VPSVGHTKIKKKKNPPKSTESKRNQVTSLQFTQVNAAGKRLLKKGIGFHKHEKC